MQQDVEGLFPPGSVLRTVEPSVLSVASELYSAFLSTFVPSTAPSFVDLDYSTSSGDSKLAVGGSTSHLYHPLGPLHRDEIKDFRDQVKSTIQSIRDACEHFSSNILDGQDSSTMGSSPSSVVTGTSSKQNQASKASTEKYLSLLKESAGSMSMLISQAQDNRRAKTILSRRKKYEHSYPILDNLHSETEEKRKETEQTGAAASRTLLILENIAASLGLDSFREDQTAFGIQPSLEHASRKVHLLSLGGKVMAIDFEVDVETGEIVKAKCSYVLDSVTIADDAAAKTLEERLKSIHKLSLSGNHPNVESLVEEGLKGLREDLRELMRLDKMTADSSLDCFRLQKEMTNQLHRICETEVKFSKSMETLPKGVHGTFLVQNPIYSSPILFHLSPARKLSKEWKQMVEKNFCAEIMKTFRMLNGYHTLRVALLSASKTYQKSPMNYMENVERSEASTPLLPLFQRVEAKDDEVADGICYEARFQPPIPISGVTGEKIMRVLSSDYKEGNLHSLRCTTGRTSLEDLICSPVQGPVISSDCNTTYDIDTGEVPLCLQFSLAENSRIGGFLCTQVQFYHINQLLRVMEILQEQLAINDLIESVTKPLYLSSQAPKAPDLNDRPLKKRKMAPISLSELLKEEKLSALPIFIHLESGAGCGTCLTFPSPNLPISEASPCRITISSDIQETNMYNVSAEGNIQDGFDEKMAAKVLGVSRDLGIFMRWLVLSLEARAQPQQLLVP